LPFLPMVRVIEQRLVETTATLGGVDLNLHFSRSLSETTHKNRQNEHYEQRTPDLKTLLSLSYRTPIQKWLTQDADEVDLDGVVEEIVGEDVVEDVVARARMRRRSGCP